MSNLVCGGAVPCDKCQEGVTVIFLTPWPGMLRGIRQERHQHEQAGRHVTGGKIPCVWHEDPACHQGICLCFRKGNWPGGRGLPEGCLAPMYGKHVKEGFIIISAFLYYYLYGLEWNGCTCVFDHFYSWKCFGLCLSNILYGFVRLAKNDIGQVRRNKGCFCGKLFDNLS